jgi:hypothetical protein
MCPDASCQGFAWTQVQAREVRRGVIATTKEGYRVARTHFIHTESLSAGKKTFDLDRIATIR